MSDYIKKLEAKLKSLPKNWKHLNRVQLAIARLVIPDGTVVVPRVMERVQWVPDGNNYLSHGPESVLIFEAGPFGFWT